MKLGNQLYAPEGYKELSKGRTYYFVHSDVEGERVYLVSFGISSRDGVALQTMRRAVFEAGLETGRESSATPRGIVEAAIQAELPPWLSGIDLPEVTAASVRKSGPHSPFAQAARRLAVISPLVDQVNALLTERDPIGAINRAIRELKGQKQNETRVRLWFFAYLCFKRDVRALLTEHFALGRWPRADKTGDKRGRPSSRYGRGHGHNVERVVCENIIKGYTKYCGIGIPMTKIFAASMRDKQIFACKTTRDVRGKTVFEQPDGEPTPTLGQFWYHAAIQMGIEVVGVEAAKTKSARKLRKIGRREIERRRYGTQRQREMTFESLGPFSGNVSHCLQRTMADAYNTKDHPRGFIEGHVLKKLCIARSVDLLTGFLPGIGMSFGGERRTAYNTLKFCMAVDKVRFCALFGLTIKPEDWPGDGLPPNELLDRGPGAATDDDLTEDDPMHVHSVAGAYAPRSKGPIETSHEKNDKEQFEQSYIASALTPVEMAKREILRLIKDNHTRDMSRRMTPELWQKNILPTPINLWNYMNERLRTVAIPMAFDTAVRRFLTKVKFTLKPDGIYLHQMKFDCDALRTSGIFDRASASQDVKLDGYVLELCVRHAWVEVDGNLIEVDAQLPIADRDGQLYLSIREIQEMEEQVRAAAADLKENRTAANAAMDAEFKDATGKESDAGRRVRGRAKTKSPGAAQEAADVNQMNGRSAAC